MIKITITEEGKQILRQERYNHHHPRVMLNIDFV